MLASQTIDNYTFCKLFYYQFPLYPLLMLTVPPLLFLVFDKGKINRLVTHIFREERMKYRIASVKTVGILGLVLVAVLALALACGGAAQPTQAPQPTAAPAASATPVPTKAPAPGATATPTQVVKTGPTKGGSIVIAGNVVRDTLDPTFSEDYYGLLPYYGIYQSLVKLDAQNQVKPDLGQSWDISADGTVLTFQLQRNAKFHDGTPFNADAVKFTYDRYMSDKTTVENKTNLRRSQMADIASVTKVDDYAIKITLKQPTRPFLALITERPGFILSPTAVQKDPDLFQRKPVGTGPYMVSEWTPLEKIVMVKNSSYWDSAEPLLDQITEWGIPDQSVKFAMVRTGEADIVDSMRLSDLPLAERNSNLKISKNYGGRFEIIGITVDRNAPYNNEHFRKALGYALNRQALIDAFWQSQAEPAYLPIGPASGVWFNPTLQPLKFDLAKAKEELALAGMPNGVEFKFPCASTTADLQHCEVLQSVWQQANLGIKAVIDPKPAAGHWTDWVQGKFDMIQSWRAGRPDPHINIQRIYHSKGFSNPGHYSNPEVDKLIDEVGKIYDVAKAKALYDQIQSIAQSDGHEIIQAYPYSFITMQTRLQGYAYYIDEIIRVRDLWLQK